MDNFLNAFNTKPSQANDKATSKLVPWIEKYRPKTLDDVSQQGEVVSVLKTALKNQDLPNLLFYGPPGTGKTSIILALAHNMFGVHFRERVLELNASSERGIQVIRDKVKTFAQLAVPVNKDCPPFKLIILDEADCMTVPAQAALRRIMETELKTTRFCLTCNYVSRIINPITSRCAKFRFVPLQESTAFERLKHISTSESLLISDENIKKAIHLAQGDMRRAVTLLQSASMLVQPECEVSHLILEEVSGVVPDKYLNDLIAFASEKNLDKVRETCRSLIAEGHSTAQLILQLQKMIIQSDSVREVNKAHILKAIAVMDSRLLSSADEYLQLMQVGCTLVDQLA